MSLVPVVDALKANGWVEDECVSMMSLTKPTVPPSLRPLATVWYDWREEEWFGTGNVVELDDAFAVIVATQG